MEEMLQVGLPSRAPKRLYFPVLGQPFKVVLLAELLPSNASTWDRPAKAGLSEEGLDDDDTAGPVTENGRANAKERVQGLLVDVASVSL